MGQRCAALFFFDGREHTNGDRRGGSLVSCAVGNLDADRCRLTSGPVVRDMLLAAGCAKYGGLSHMEAK